MVVAPSTPNDTVSSFSAAARGKGGTTTTTTNTANNESNNEIATYQSGVGKMSMSIISGLVSLTSIYFALVRRFHDTNTILPPVASKFCTDPNQDPCSRPDLFAFQMGSGLAILFCGLRGFIGWHVTRRVHKELPQTPEGRVFGYLPESEVLAALNFTFQFWDFCISLLIPEHATAIMLSHHLMAATVSWLSLSYQYLHYYGVFFLGLSEVSSIFLVFVDLAQYFPPVPGTLYDSWVGIVCGPMFALTFFIYRIVLWMKVSYTLWSDAIYVMQRGIPEKLRPGKSFVLYIFLALNFILTILQLYWFTIILEEVKKVLLNAKS